jgi:hypothetical protein
MTTTEAEIEEPRRAPTIRRVAHMSTPFVKYTPDVETADPEFNENLQTMIAMAAAGHRRAARQHMSKATDWSEGRSRYSTSFLLSTRRASTPQPEGMTR